LQNSKRQLFGSFSNGDKKNKKVTLRRLPFLFFLSPFEKSLKNLFFSSFAKASLTIDFLRNDICLLKLPFLTSLMTNFSTLYIHMLSKFAIKSVQKPSIFSGKANYARSLMKRKASQAQIWKPFLICCCLLLFNSCKSSAPSIIQPTQFTQNVMTIDYHISVGDPLTNQKKLQIQKMIDMTFQEIDMIYNKWNPNSELSQLNLLPANSPYLLSPQLYQFLQRLDMLVQLSEGRFDPTIEPLQQLWKRQLAQGKCPSKKEIEDLKPCLGWHTISFDHGMFYKQDGRTQLDLGGVAKGLCVDLLLERLHQSGLNNLYVEWGGEIRTLGIHPAQRLWHVYITHLSNPDPSQAIAHLELIDRALATSGDYFQYWKVITEMGEEKIYCHIFNPLTLSPLEVKKGSVASASLLAYDCVTADALAKVLMLFNTVEEAQEWLEKLQEQQPDLACWIATR
jgi:FAD:protein FMN transferase